MRKGAVGAHRVRPRRVQRGQLEDRNPEVGSLDAPLLANQSLTPQIDPTAFREPSEGGLGALISSVTGAASMVNRNVNRAGDWYLSGDVTIPGLDVAASGVEAAVGGVARVPGAVERFVSPSQEEAARRRAALAALMSEFMSPSMEGLEADLRSRGFDGEVSGAPLMGNLYTWRKAPPFPKMPRAGSDLRKMIRAVLGI